MVFGHGLAMVLGCSLTPCQDVAKPPSADVTKPVELPGEELREQLARQATFELVLSYRDKRRRNEKRPERVQPGFLVSPDGLGVTSLAAFHLLHDADVVTSDSSRRWELRVLGSDTTEDLGLVRVTPRSKGDEQGNSPLPFFEISDAEEVLSGETWTIVAAPGEPFSVVNNEDLLREREDPQEEDLLSELLPEGMIPGDGETTWNLRRTRWSERLGGSPIVDQEGKLRGVWAWTPGGQAVQLIPASRIKRLLSKYEDAKPAKISMVAKRTATNGGLVFPTLRWPKERGRLKGDATRLISQLPEKCICFQCDGRGKVDDGGKESVNGRFQWVPRWIVCPECEGDRLEDGQDLWDTMRRIALNLSRLGDEREPLLEELEDKVGDVVKVNKPYFLDKINDSASEVLSKRRLKPGDGVALALPNREWTEVRSPWLSVESQVCESWAFDQMIFPEPIARSVRREGHAALILGVVAGTVEWGGHTWTVIARASVVPVDASNTRLGE